MRTQQSQPTKPELHPEEWVDQYGDDLVACAYARLRDEVEAEEAVQETFLAAVRKQDQYRGDAGLGAWLFGILKRKIIDQVRERNKQHRVLPERKDRSQAAEDNLSWLHSIPDVDVEDHMLMTELWQIVLHCLTTLSQDQADAFTLTVMDQMDTPAACRVLNVTESGFRVRLHRARLRLARCVSKKWDVEK